jgi:hypothetical protein
MNKEKKKESPWDLVNKLYGPKSKKKYYTKEQINEMTLAEICEIIYDQDE